MSVITLNLPDDIETEMNSLNIKKEEFIITALKEKINSYKISSIETLLTEGYKFSHEENDMLSKEFIHSDLESWNEY